MQFSIVSKNEWDKFEREGENTNLIHSWEFGEAKAIADKVLPIRYLVSDLQGRPVALLQVLTKKFFKYWLTVQLNRGPILLINDHETSLEEMKLSILKAFVRYSASQNWLMLIMAPEIHQSNNTILDYSKLGWRIKNRSWGSALLNLTLSEHDLLMGFKGRWRRNLRKAQNKNVVVQLTPLSKNLIDTVIELYKNAQNEQGYRGVSSDLVRSLSQQRGNSFEFVVHLAKSEKNENLGVFVSTINGKTATYFLSCSTSAGKECLVNYSLIWAAIRYAKQANCNAFDVGGITKNTTPGILQYKTGLNGVTYNLIDWFISFPLFRRKN